jgi:hypothetical protein
VDALDYLWLLSGRGGTPEIEGANGTLNPLLAARVVF